MFAELVCLEMTPAKWHGGGSIFEGISMVRFASQATFRTAAYLDVYRNLMPLEGQQ